MNENLDEERLFFDPHPGLAGAFFPIPGAVKKVADELNGARMPLRKAIKKVKKATRGKVEVYKNCITLETKFLGPFGTGTNFYRVIRFKSISRIQ